VNPARALEEHGKAVREHEDALGSGPSTRLEQAGCIKYFEFGFELAWKTIKAFAERQGMSDIVSPRDCLKAAFALHWIDDEAAWLELSAEGQGSADRPTRGRHAVTSRLTARMDADDGPDLRGIADNDDDGHPFVQCYQVD
jgi:nucleotidyltransferase substrate binding protein (TIGR01987 family)